MGAVNHYRNKYIPIIRKIMFIIFTIIGMYYTYCNLNHFEFVLDDSEICLFDSYSPAYYLAISDNTGYTNINGVSNFVNNMYKEGYELYEDNSTNSYLDYSFLNNMDNSVWRLYYSLKNRYIAFLYSDYEASGRGFLYIIESNGNM